MLYVYSFVIIEQCRYHSDINNHHHWNMHILTLQDNPLKKFFRKCKEEHCTAEEEKAVKVGRLMEILQEQSRPTFSVHSSGD